MDIFFTLKAITAPIAGSNNQVKITKMSFEMMGCTHFSFPQGFPGRDLAVELFKIFMLSGILRILYGIGYRSFLFLNYRTSVSDFYIL